MLFPIFLMWILKKILSAVLEKNVLTDILIYWKWQPHALSAGGRNPKIISEEGGPSLQKQANNLTSLIICFLSNWYFFSLLSILRPLYFFIYFYLKNLLFYFINSRYPLHILVSSEHVVLSLFWLYNCLENIYFFFYFECIMKKKLSRRINFTISTFILLIN